MYIPSSFAETDQARMHDVIEKHSFATLVSLDGSVPAASHLPLLLNREQGSHGTLVGHMAKANPQWRHAEGQNVLAIFHGPHAYISPTWYAAANTVPTWNYVAVHAYGTLRLETDHHRLLQILHRYVEFYEAHQEHPWSLDQVEPSMLRGLIDGIVGFEMEIDRIEGKWKLNQNHEPARRDRVIQALKTSGGENQHQIADLMSEALES